MTKPATATETAIHTPRRRKDAHDAREVALETLIRLETTGAYPKVFLNARLGASAMSDADRDLTRELVRGTIIWRSRIDHVLSWTLNRPLENLTVAIRNILRLGVYQILFLNHVPAYAAVSESVRLAKQYGHAGTAGLVNALLRRISSLRPDRLIPNTGAEPADRIAALWSHPAWMVRRWVDRLGAQDAESLCRANNRIPPVILRHNRTKGPIQALLDRLHAEGVRVRSHPLQEEFLVVEEGRGLFKTATFQGGWVTAQDVSAGLAVCLLDPQPGETVLDLCAAPGGKTGFIAERMGDRGRVVALDRHAGRLRRLTESIRRLGLRSVEAHVADALTANPDGGFDRVLVDAPCSGLGVLARRPDVRWRRQETDLQELAKLQAQLLARGAASVRPGGIVVYSTCSTELEENENVAEMFLTAHPEFEVDPARDHFGESCSAGVPPAIAEATGRYVQTWPHHHDCDGAFAARFQRHR